MHASISALITINGGTEELLSGATASVCGITSLQMGVFGGIIVGLGVAALHNRFYKIELPQVLLFRRYTVCPDYFCPGLYGRRNPDVLYLGRSSRPESTPWEM